ncbi:MAG: DUF4270 family protein [Bacteroidota bacterium]|nr:DUF4270 family protein [Bacteroidota bacterium]
MPTLLRRITNRFSLVFLVILFISFSCKKGTGLIGIGTNSDGFVGEVIDTFTVNTYTLPDDTLRSTGWPAHPIGHLDDLMFGKTDAGMVFRLLLPKENLTFPTTVHIDSVRLSMCYAAGTVLYGDTTKSQTLMVSEISDQLYQDTTYLSTQKVNKIAKVGSWTGLHNIHDDIHFVVKGTKYFELPQVRFNVDTNFGRKIVNGGSFLATSNDFANLVKGLYIEADPNNPGNVISFTTSTYQFSHLTIFYNDSEYVAFPLTIDGNNPGLHFSTFSHNFSGTLVDIARTNPTQIQQQSFIQAAAGNKMRVEIPHLSNFFAMAKGKGLSIQKAEILIEGDLNNTFNGLYPLPKSILLFHHDGKGKEEPILDRYDKYFYTSSGQGYPLSLPSAYFGGKQYDGNKYSLPFTRQLQNALNNYLLTGTNNIHGFYVTIPTAIPVGSARMIVPQGNVKLKITYSPAP